MSINYKHNYKTFTKSPPASLLHSIGNILNHLSGKCSHSLTMAALIQLAFVKTINNGSACSVLFLGTTRVVFSLLKKFRARDAVISGS